MKKPNYVLTFKEAVEIPVDQPKSATNKRRWKVIFVLTMIFVSYDLLLYQSIEGLFATFGLLAIYIRLTFPKTKSKGRILLWSILSFMLGFALIVEENDLILSLALPIFFWRWYAKELEKVLVPVEIQFYDDHFIIYREKCNVSLEPRYIVREYNTVFYEDVKDVHFGKFRKKVLKFYGKAEVLRHKYNDDGSIQEKALLHETLENHYTTINTKESPDVDFVRKIERYSPLKVTRDEKIR